MLLPTGRGKKAGMDLLDLPRFTRETLGLSGLNLSTDLLVGADRARLEGIRDRADRASCACLLLVEPEAQAVTLLDESARNVAITRLRKVVEAAHILGCSAAAVRVQAGDDEASLLRAAAALKPIVERAEKLDINLLISPNQGLTQRPERVTELLKKVGGFRIGTYPDFEMAAASADPVAYLHRLTPYATAVCASVVKFLNEEDQPPRMVDKKAAAKAAKNAAGASRAAGQGIDTPPAGEEKEDEPAEGGEEAALDDFDELEALIDDELDDEDATPPLKALKHEPYPLRPLVGAVAAVGYDGPLSIEYRGTADPTMSILQTRDTLLALLEQDRNRGG